MQNVGRRPSHRATWFTALLRCGSLKRMSVRALTPCRPSTLSILDRPPSHLFDPPPPPATSSLSLHAAPATTAPRPRVINSYPMRTWIPAVAIPLIVFLLLAFVPGIRE